MMLFLRGAIGRNSTVEIEVSVLECGGFGWTLAYEFTGLCGGVASGNAESLAQAAVAALDRFYHVCDDVQKDTSSMRTGAHVAMAGRGDLWQAQQCRALGVEPLPQRRKAAE